MAETNRSLVDKAKLWVRQNIFGFIWTTILGIVLGGVMTKVSNLPEIFGILTIVLIAMSVGWIAYQFAKHLPIDRTKTKHLGVTLRADKLYWVGATILLCGTVILSSLFLWSPMINRYTPKPSEVPAIGELTNEYVREYKDPVYKSDSRTYQYALLLEFGVTRTEVSGNITFSTGNKYLLSDWYLGTPLKSDGSQNPIEDGHITIGFCVPQIDDKSPPIYSIATGSCLIYSDRSLYIYFESDKPIEVKSARFNGEQIEMGISQ